MGPILESLFVTKKYYFVILVLSQFFQSVGLSLFNHAVLHGGKKVAKKHADASQNCDRKRDLQL